MADKLVCHFQPEGNKEIKEKRLKAHVSSEWHTTSIRLAGSIRGLSAKSCELQELHEEMSRTYV